VLEHIVHPINSTARNLTNIVLGNFGHPKLDDEQVSQQFKRFLGSCGSLLFCQFSSSPLLSPAVPGCRSWNAPGPVGGNLAIDHAV